MTALDTGQARPAVGSRPGRWHRLGSVEMLGSVVILALFGRAALLRLLGSAQLQALLTVFVSVVVQALPFLVLGTVLSAAIAAFVPARIFDRAMPTDPVRAVPTAALSAVALPTGQAGAVPAASLLLRRGVTPAAAFAYLLASPAINPVVLVSTAVAFPGRPEVVLARFGAGLFVACGMGWLWLRFGRPDWLRPARLVDPHTEPGWPGFWASCRHDVVQAGGFLVIGAFAMAVLTVIAPPQWLQAVAANGAFSVLALALLAVLLSVCAEADAFLMATLTSFSLTARLAFLVAGPMVDLRLFNQQATAFGPRFAVRFAPATLGVAILASVLAGAVLL